MKVGKGWKAEVLLSLMNLCHDEEWPFEDGVTVPTGVTNTFAIGDQANDRRGARRAAC